MRTSRARAHPVGQRSEHTREVDRDGPQLAQLGLLGIVPAVVLALVHAELARLDGFGGREVGVVAEVLQQSDAADAVGEDVVGPHEQGRAVALEAADEGDVPRGPIRVEWHGIEQ